MKRGVVVLLAITAVVIVLVFTLKPKPAPVSFEPEELVFSESGTQQMSIVNQSEYGVVLHLDWPVTSSCKGVSSYGPETVRLIPGETEDVEVDVRYLCQGALATVAPKVDSWGRGVRVPGRERIHVPSMRRDRPPVYYFHTVIPCYYVNDTDSARWLLIHPKLEERPDDLFTYISWREAAHKDKPIEPGKGKWYEAAIVPAWNVDTSSAQTVTLVLEVEELPWKPEVLWPLDQEGRTYRAWDKERQNAPAEYPVKLHLVLEKPNGIELREDYIFHARGPYVDTGETFSKTLHFLNSGPSRDIQITTSIEKKDLEWPRIPVEVTVNPQRQIFWRRKVTSVDLEIRVAEIDIDIEKTDVYYRPRIEVTLTLTPLGEVSDEEAPD